MKQLKKITMAIAGTAFLSNLAMAQSVKVGFGLTTRINKGTVEFRVSSSNTLNSNSTAVMNDTVLGTKSGLTSVLAGGTYTVQSVASSLSAAQVAQLSSIGITGLTATAGLSSKTTPTLASVQAANQLVKGQSFTVPSTASALSASGVTVSGTAVVQRAGSVNATPIFDSDSLVNPICTSSTVAGCTSTSGVDNAAVNGLSNPLPIVVPAASSLKRYLQLRVLPAGDGNAYDHADWANAVLTCNEGAVPLSNLVPTSLICSSTQTGVILNNPGSPTPPASSCPSISNGWGPFEVDSSNGEQYQFDGHQISIRGQTFKKGLGVHATSNLIFDLSAPISSVNDVNNNSVSFPNGLSGCQLSATIGIDDEVAGYLTANDGTISSSPLADSYNPGETVIANRGAPFDPNLGYGWLTSTGSAMNHILMSDARIRAAIDSNGQLVQELGYRSTYASVSDAGIIFSARLPGTQFNGYTVTITNPPTLNSSMLSIFGTALTLANAVANQYFSDFIIPTPVTVSPPAQGSAIVSYTDSLSGLSVTCDTSSSSGNTGLVITNPSIVRWSVVSAVNSLKSMGCPIDAADANFVYGYVPKAGVKTLSGGYDDSSYDNLGFVAGSNMPINAAVRNPNDPSYNASLIPNPSYEYNALINLQDNQYYNMGGVIPYLYYGGMVFRQKIPSSDTTGAFSKYNNTVTVQFAESNSTTDTIDKLLATPKDLVSYTCTPTSISISIPTPDVLAQVLANTVLMGFPDELRIAIAYYINNDPTCPATVTPVSSWNNDPTTTSAPLPLKYGLDGTFEVDTDYDYQNLTFDIATVSSGMADGDDYMPIYEHVFSTGNGDPSAVALAHTTVITGDPYFTNSVYQFIAASSLTQLFSNPTYLFLSPLSLDGSGVRADFTAALSRSAVSGTLVNPQDSVARLNPLTNKLESDYTTLSRYCSSVAKPVAGKAATKTTPSVAASFGQVDCSKATPSPCVKSGAMYNCQTSATHFVSNPVDVSGTLFLQTGPKAVNNKISALKMDLFCQPSSVPGTVTELDPTTNSCKTLTNQQLADVGSPLLDINLSSWSLDTTTPGATDGQATLTVSNFGNGVADLSALTLPTGFSVVSTTCQSTLAAATVDSNGNLTPTTCTYVISDSSGVPTSAADLAKLFSIGYTDGNGISQAPAQVTVAGKNETESAAFIAHETIMNIVLSSDATTFYIIGQTNWNGGTPETVLNAIKQVHLLDGNNAFLNNLQLTYVINKLCSVNGVPALSAPYSTDAALLSAADPSGGVYVNQPCLGSNMTHGATSFVAAKLVGPANQQLSVTTPTMTIRLLGNSTSAATMTSTSAVSNAQTGCNATGTCTAAQCNSNQVLVGNYCEDTKCTPGTLYSCQAAGHSQDTVSVWNETCNAQGTDYSACQVTSCNGNYALVGGSCQEVCSSVGATRACAVNAESGTNPTVYSVSFNTCSAATNSSGASVNVWSSSCSPSSPATETFDQNYVSDAKSGSSSATLLTCHPGSTQSCTPSNGDTNGTYAQTCTSDGSGFGACTVASCNDGFSVVGGSCQCNKGNVVVTSKTPLDPTYAWQHFGISYYDGNKCSGLYGVNGQYCADNGDGTTRLVNIVDRAEPVSTGYSFLTTDSSGQLANGSIIPSLNKTNSSVQYKFSSNSQNFISGSSGWVVSPRLPCASGQINEGFGGGQDGSLTDINGSPNCSYILTDTGVYNYQSGGASYDRLILTPWTCGSNNYIKQ